MGDVEKDEAVEENATRFLEYDHVINSLIETFSNLKNRRFIKAMTTIKGFLEQ